MKPVLQISILLNLILLGGLIFFWTNQQREGVTSPLPANMKAGSLAPAGAVSAPPIVQQEEPQPFRWSQLVSSNDYRMFVANLRAAGCPEPTVEDIVRGDADRAFFAKRSELHVDGTEPGPWSAQAQMQIVAYLLGQAIAPAREVAKNTTSSSQVNVASPSSQADTAPSSQVSGSRNDSQNTPILMPLVFQNVDPSALNLNDQQVQAINNLRQGFVNEIGGPNQDPHDPAYLNRWQGAQPEADTMLRAVAGITVWENYQVATWDANYQAAMQNGH